ncbi:MAG: hypothetical protein GMKNLPBB_00277 [Myxococcota bacterium]|nr:hypothetical protein [Myxococcota bacterium]
MGLALAILSGCAEPGADPPFQFDREPPRIVRTNPAGDETSAATGTWVTAWFSEALDPRSVSSTTFSVHGPGEIAASGEVLWRPSDLSLVFRPFPGQLEDEQAEYRAVIANVTDLAGNRLPHETDWKFRVKGRPPPPARPVPADYARDIAPIFAQGCNASGCHGGDVVSRGLRLDGPGAPGNLIGQPSSTGKPLIQPGKPGESAIYLSVIGADPIMPPAPAAPLSTEHQILIFRWIAEMTAVP